MYERGETPEDWEANATLGHRSTDDSRMSGLLPCPFCGGKPVGPEFEGKHWWIACPKCQYVIDGVSERILTNWWNKRYKPR